MGNRQNNYSGTTEESEPISNVETENVNKTAPALSLRPVGDSDNPSKEKDEKRIRIFVDSVPINVLREQQSIYDCVMSIPHDKRNNINSKSSISVLCHHPLLHDPLKDEECCGLCYVEVVDGEGNAMNIRSCTKDVEENMKISTSFTSSTVHNNIRKILNEKLSCHALDCGSCFYDGKCFFKKNLLDKHSITKETLSSEQLKKFQLARRRMGQVIQNEAVTYEPSKCLQCLRCVRICRQNGFLHESIVNKIEENGYKDFNIEEDFYKVMFSKQSMKRSAEGDEDDDEEENTNMPCVSCGQCISLCSVSGVIENFDYEEVLNLLFFKKGVFVACVLDPVFKMSLPEIFGTGGSPKKKKRTKRKAQLMKNEAGPGPSNESKKGGLLSRRKNKKILDNNDENNTTTSTSTATSSKRASKPGLMNSAMKEELENQELVIVTLLKKIGFDYVFDGTIGYDLKAMCEVESFLERTQLNKQQKQQKKGDLTKNSSSSLYTSKEKEESEEEEEESEGEEPENNQNNQKNDSNNSNFPFLSSECYSFIRLIENKFPKYKKNLSKLKPSYLMLGDLIKKSWWKNEKKRILEKYESNSNHQDEQSSIKSKKKKKKKKNENNMKLIVVYISPCVARKEEIKRFDIYGKEEINIDYVLSIREMMKMMETQQLNPKELLSRWKRSKINDFTSESEEFNPINNHQSNQSQVLDGRSVELKCHDVLSFPAGEGGQVIFPNPTGAGFIMSGITGGEIEAFVNIFQNSSTIRGLHEDSSSYDSNTNNNNTNSFKINDNICVNNFQRNGTIFKHRREEQQQQQQKTMNDNYDGDDDDQWDEYGIIPSSSNTNKEKIEYHTISVHGGKNIQSFLGNIVPSSPCFVEAKVCYGGCIGSSGNFKVWKLLEFDKRYKRFLEFHKNFADCKRLNPLHYKQFFQLKDYYKKLMDKNFDDVDSESEGD